MAASVSTTPVALDSSKILHPAAHSRAYKVLAVAQISLNMLAMGMSAYYATIPTLVGMAIGSLLYMSIPENDDQPSIRSAICDAMVSATIVAGSVFAGGTANFVAGYAGINGASMIAQLIEQMV